MASATDELPTWRKTCSTCGAYYPPYCYGIELMAGSDRELEYPYKTEPDDWCVYWRRERKTEWNGKPCGRRIVQMTATEELRRMLDERGVPWKDYGYENHTWWGEWHAENRASVNGLFLKVEGVVTPEHAIAATLGTGTCEADETDVIKCWVKCKDEPSVEHMELIHVMECSECGHTYEHVNGGYEFCPRCGRKVVDA